MNNSVAEWFQNLQISDLQPIVCQILDRPDVEVLDWQIQPVSGGGTEHTGRGFGIYRVTGTARVDDHATPWSAVVKVSGPSDAVERNDPMHFEYWKREVLVYQSGVLDHLPGSVVAPRCYAIQELPGEKHYLWLEVIHEADSDWAMEQHQLAARHLGEFNGAYLTGHPLPEQASWMLPDRTHQVVNGPLPHKEQLLQFSKTEHGRWLSRNSIERMMRLWEQHPLLLIALDRLPTCFCHHDAFRRNLMLRQTKSGTTETVAIDWAYAGLGKVGQEIGITTSIALYFLDVVASDARALDEAVFAGYSDGLRDAGWQGDLQLARFGYTVTAALNSGIGFTVIVANAMQTPEGAAIGEAIFGRPLVDIIEQYAVALPFLLDPWRRGTRLIAVNLEPIHQPVAVLGTDGANSWD